MWAMMAPGLTEEDRAELLRHYAAPGGMRGGFLHYATLLEDGRRNRANLGEGLKVPVLVLGGEKGIPRDPLLSGARRVATRVQADTVPDAGHVYAADNPAWVADRLARFFGWGGPGAEDGG